MIEIKMQFKYFNLEMVIGKKEGVTPNLHSPWFTKPDKDVNLDTPTIAYQDNSFDENMVEKTPITHITKLAEKYQTELNTNQGFPPETKTPPSTVLDTHTNRADVSSFTPSSISLPENETIAGLYNIGSEEDDLMAKDFENYPDVEIIDDEYEVRLTRATKLANQRYATYKETHNID